MVQANYLLAFAYHLCTRNFNIFQLQIKIKFNYQLLGKFFIEVAGFLHSICRFYLEVQESPMALKHALRRLWGCESGHYFPSHTHSNTHMHSGYLRPQFSYFSMLLIYLLIYVHPTEQHSCSCSLTVHLCKADDIYIYIHRKFGR